MALIADGTPPRKPRSARAGFTLVEVIVALGLFALIALAGFSLARTVLDTQARTDDRLSRMSEIQRALFVIASDLDQVSGSIEGGGETLVFQKTDASGRPLIVRYARTGDALTRTVSGPMGERAQPLLRGVGSAQWSFHLAGLGWAPATGPVAPAADGSPPPALPAVRAVALDLGLMGPDGRPTTLRRVVATPEIAP